MVADGLIEYFTAERQGGFLLAGMAIASFGFSAWLWFSRSAFLPMVWPLIIIGVLQLFIGLTVALRTPAQISSLEQDMHQSVVTMTARESQRMQAINRNFRIFKTGEVVFIIIGIVLALLFPLPGTWSAVGLGLVLEAAALLVFDSFAHHRAVVYVEWLQGLT